jgi:hypothetical protein
MLLRIPHVARAGRCISSSPLTSISIPSSFTTQLQHQARPFSLSWKSKLRMASEDPEKVKEVRKYLQQSHDRIFDNNKKWAEKMREENPEFFSDLSRGQTPEYLWIGKLYMSFTTNGAMILTLSSQAVPTHASPPKPSQASKPARCSSIATSPTSSTTSISTSCPSSTTRSAISRSNTSSSADTTVAAASKPP